jgi:cytochrome c biogenesis factor
LAVDAVDLSVTGLVAHPATWWLGAVGLAVAMAGLLAGLWEGRLAAWARDFGFWLADLWRTIWAFARELTAPNAALTLALARRGLVVA